MADRLIKILSKNKFCIFRKTLGLEFTIAGTISKEVRWYPGSRDKPLNGSIKIQGSAGVVGRNNYLKEAYPPYNLGSKQANQKRTTHPLVYLLIRSSIKLLQSRNTPRPIHTGTVQKIGRVVNITNYITDKFRDHQHFLQRLVRYGVYGRI